MRNSENKLCLQGIMNHTATVLSSQGYKKKVLIIGGITENFKLNDRIHFLK